MNKVASQVTSLTIVYWIVYSDADQRKHQSSAPLGNIFTFKKRNRDIDVQLQSSLVHKYLFYTCTDFGWLIRVNAEAMLLWNQKTCKQTKIVKFSHFIFDHKGQLWQDSIQRLLHISTNFFFLWLKYISFYSKRFPGVSTLHLDNYLCYEENENTRKKEVFYTKYKIFPKIKLQLANADTVLGRRHVCIIMKNKNWNR